MPFIKSICNHYLTNELLAFLGRIVSSLLAQTKTRQIPATVEGMARCAAARLPWKHFFSTVACDESLYISPTLFTVLAFSFFGRSHFHALFLLYKLSLVALFLRRAVITGDSLCRHETLLWAFARITNMYWWRRWNASLNIRKVKKECSTFLSRKTSKLRSASLALTGCCQNIQPPKHVQMTHIKTLERRSFWKSISSAESAVNAFIMSVFSCYFRETDCVLASTKTGGWRILVAFLISPKKFQNLRAKDRKHSRMA